jgi:hypothetical protein
MALLDLTSLYANQDGRFVRATARRVRADEGAVSGRVYLDYNANARPDPGEPGVAGVEVKLGDLYTAVTDEDGYYILPSLNQRRVRVYLEMESLPAIYSAVHGSQIARVEHGNMTEVDLFVTPLISISGKVIATAPDGDEIPIYGLRMVLRDARSGEFVADSITAQNGTYYLGNILPGEYVLRVDPETLAARYRIKQMERTITVKPTRDVLDIDIPPFQTELVAETPDGT